MDCVSNQLRDKPCDSSNDGKLSPKKTLIKVNGLKKKKQTMWTKSDYKHILILMDLIFAWAHWNLYNVSKCEIRITFDGNFYPTNQIQPMQKKYTIKELNIKDMS